MDNLKREFYFLSGFELTRKIVLQGATSEVPDMLHELADILADVELQDGDRLSSLNVSNMGNTTDGSRSKIVATLISAPRK